MNEEVKDSQQESYARSGGYSGYGYYAGSYGMQQQKYGNLKNVAQLDFKNPYENIDADGNLLDMAGMRQGNLDFQSDELQEYNLPRHKAPIEYFKILRHDLYETEKRYLPNIILTVTKNNEVFMWQENLSVVINLFL